MRKNIYSVLSFLFMFVAIFGLSGCLFVLSTPSISRDGSIVSWDSVANAGSYEVAFSDGTYTNTISTTAVSVDLSPYLTVGSWSVKVKAKSSSFIRSDSVYSEELAFEVLSSLQAPTSLSAEEDANDNVTISWGGVVGAESYTIKIEFEGSDTITVSSDGTTTYKDITSYVDEGGTYTVSVCSNSSTYNGEEGVFVSAFSTSINYIYKIQLSAPEISSFVKVGSAYNLTWSSVSGAVGYRVSLLGTDKTIYTTSTGVDVSTIEGGLPSIATVESVADSSVLQIAFVQAIGDNEYNLSSDFSLGKVYYGLTASKANFEKIDLDYFYADFNGTETFDFCADTQDELDSLVVFAVYYRLNVIKFYQNFTGSTAISNAFNAYAEIMSLTKWTYGTDLITMRMEYDTPTTPSQTATESYDGTDENPEQVEYGTISSFSTTPRSSDENYDITDLPVYSRTKTMNVYTSEQLFMAVQAGYLPVFPSDCGAKTIWESACAVSMDIIDDGMTDYEKVKAIFDWVCYKNVYDFNLLSYTEEQASLSPFSTEYQRIEALIRNFKGFYLEGMFLDDGQAVCDGISKTFALLCGIENIECYKVNGTVSGGGHAWNKVALDLNSDTTLEWYTIDCTWNDYYTAENEWLTHNYFLVTDSSIDSDHSEQWPNRDTSSTTFNYFTTTTVTIESTSYDMYVESSDEISTLVNYLCTNYDNFELRIDYDGVLDSRWANTISEIESYTGWTYRITYSSSGYKELVAYKTSY